MNTKPMLNIESIDTPFNESMNNTCLSPLSPNMSASPYKFRMDQGDKSVDYCENFQVKVFEIFNIIRNYMKTENDILKNYYVLNKNIVWKVSMNVVYENESIIWEDDKRDIIINKIKREIDKLFF